MIILVDGYNVIKREHGTNLVSAFEKKKFINHVRSYARKSGNKVIIVFDGEPYDDIYPEQTRFVSVVYAGMRETADDYIIRYMMKHKNKDMLLVSSDRELNAHADACNIPSLDADKFSMILRDVRVKKNHAMHNAKVIKTSSESIPELDELMMKVSMVGSEIKHDDTPHTKKTSDTLSKKERALLKKVKKL